MIVRTFTRFWTFERKLHSLNDFTLPMPISFRAAGAFIIVGIPWWALLALIRVPFFHTTGWWVYLFVPGILAYVSTRPIFQKRTAFEYAQSQIRYLMQPKRLGGLRPVPHKYNEENRLNVKIFTKNKKRDTL